LFGENHRRNPERSFRSGIRSVCLAKQVLRTQKIVRAIDLARQSLRTGFYRVADCFQRKLRRAPVVSWKF
jgi:hypothetical protein